VERPLKVYYDNELIGEFKADIIADDKVILELKSVKDLGGGPQRLDSLRGKLS